MTDVCDYCGQVKPLERSGVANIDDRTSYDVLVSIAQMMVEMLAEQRHLRAALGSSSRSSVELLENSKGAVQVTVKCYVDSAPIDDACTEAVAAFATLKQEVERGQMEQWRSTVAALNGGIEK